MLQGPVTLAPPLLPGVLPLTPRSWRAKDWTGAGKLLVEVAMWTFLRPMKPAQQQQLYQPRTAAASWVPACRWRPPWPDACSAAWTAWRRRARTMSLRPRGGGGRAQPHPPAGEPLPLGKRFLAGSECPSSRLASASRLRAALEVALLALVHSAFLVFSADLVAACFACNLSAFLGLAFSCVPVPVPLSLSLSARGFLWFAARALCPLASGPRSSDTQL